MSVPGMTPRATSGSSSAAAVAAVDRLARMAGQVRRLLREQAIAFGVMRIAVVCLAAWGVFAHERAMLGDEGERDAAALVQTAERVASRSLADLDGTLVRLADRAGRDGAAVDWRSLAEEGSALIGERGAFAVFDASGAVALGAAAAVSETERRTLVDGARRPIAPADPSMASPGRVVLARRLADRDGGALGVLVAVVDPASLIAEMAERDASRGGVALVERTGRVLAGVGALERRGGREPAARRTSARRRCDRTGGAWRRPTGLRRRNRQFAVRRRRDAARSRSRSAPDALGRAVRRSRRRS